MRNETRSLFLHIPLQRNLAKVNQALLAIIIMLSLMAIPHVTPVNAATTLNLVAVADTWMRQDNPGYNYGGSATIQHSPKTSAFNNSLFLWNLTSIPLGIKVTAASLTFSVTVTSDYYFNLFQVRRAWVEGSSLGSSSTTSANWNTYNGSASWELAGARGTASDRYDVNLWDATVSTFSTSGKVTIPLNANGVAIVQSWVDSPTTNYGFTVQCVNGGPYSHYWTVASSEATPETDRPILSVTYDVGPTITTSPADLMGFSAAVGQPSVEQFYTVAGNNLGTDNLFITPPSDFQISTTSGSNFTNALSLTPTNGSVSATIFVRFVPSSATIYSNLNISHVSGTASANVAVSGSSVPAITTQSSLASFNAAVGTNSSEQSYTVSGINLTSAINITPPTDFLVSTTSGSGYTSSLSIAPTTGVVTSIPIYVVFNRPSPGTTSGKITHASTGAASVDVAVNGTAIQYYSLTTITSPTAGNITLSPPGGIYPSGSVISITAVANNGFAFNSWSGDLIGSANPVSITINGNRTITANFVEVACTDLSLNVAEDTHIRSGNQSSLNYGGSSLIRVNPFEQIGTSDGQFTGALLKWDFSGFGMPANAIITAASLRFNVTDASNNTYYLYNLRRDWVEGENNGNTGSGASWSYFDAGINPWGTAGAQNTSSDRYDTNLWNATAADFNATGSRSFILNGNGIGIIQGWIRGDVANYGLTIQNYSGSATDIWTASSSEAPSSSNWPKLNLTYCIPSQATIRVTAALSAFTAAVGVPSAEQSFTVSAVNLNDDLLISAPNPFEIATSSRGIFTPSLNLTPISGIVNSTTIYIRFKPTIPGVYNGNISFTSAGAATVNLPTNGSTINSPPSAVEPLPANGTANVATPPTLSVNIIDPDHDVVNVSYYGRPMNLVDPEPFELIGTVAGVSTGSTATIIWTRNFTTGIGYEWYSVVDDGLATSSSPIWVFTAGDPTGVDLNYFCAYRASGGVQLVWETVNEATLAGFNLYRREPGGKFEQVNAELIPPARGGQPEGFAYAYLDESAQPGLRYEYRLESVETDLQAGTVILADYYPYSLLLPLIRR
jgi:hypothetical protein